MRIGPQLHSKSPKTFLFRWLFALDERRKHQLQKERKCVTDDELSEAGQRKEKDRAPFRNHLDLELCLHAMRNAPQAATQFREDCEQNVTFVMQRFTSLGLSHTDLEADVTTFFEAEMSSLFGNCKPKPGTIHRWSAFSQ